MPAVHLTTEQRSVLDALLVGTSREPVQTLGGYAGTGKTTVLAELARLRPNYAVVAPTGKAADVLRRKGVDRAETIHSAIYTPKKIPGGGVEFVLRPLPPCSGFLVDEASMVGERLHRDLASFGVPVIYLGDHGQLPPVKGTLNLMADPTHRLERIHRNAGPIARFAEHLREGGSAPRFDSADAVRIVSPRDVTPGLILGHDQCIAAYNRTRHGLNRRVREHLGPAAKGD
jgi:exodeoxyribonuclease-5